MSSAKSCVLRFHIEVLRSWSITAQWTGFRNLYRHERRIVYHHIITLNGMHKQFKTAVH